MADTSNSTAHSLKVGDALHGFVVESIDALPEIDGLAIVMRHKKAGTPLLWLANDDENKSFSITFKTPPADDTGVFHILEHSVLCGSDRYPVKEPFVNLLKTSMQTFLNALTFSDKTMYPVASTNEQDLLNLMDVYMDAVLHPMLHTKRSIFEQEGWHYETAEGENGEEIVRNGVVLNEMKGAMSDPDDVAVAGLNAALFPDTAYGFESGGAPSAIPTLTYESYMDTHARHYHVSNAKVVLYGDIALEPELELLDTRYLSCADAPAGMPNPLELQAPVVNDDAVRLMATSEDNACVLVGYVIGTFKNRTDILACDILTDALMGSNEAPLKKLIIESGLGYDADAFVFDGLLQPYVAFELRGCEKGAAAEFRQLLDREFARMAREGVPRENLVAALDSAAFNLRERDSGYADGVALAINSMSSWLYDDASPVDYLRYEESMTQMREGLSSSYWEDLVERYFVLSGHRACCELVPVDEGSDGLAQEPDCPEATEENLSSIRQAAEELHRIQDLPDDPEALLSLPRLSLADVGAGRPESACHIVPEAPLPCLYHEVPTRKIDYVYHYFDLSHATWDEMPYVTLACLLFGKLATASHSAAELDTLIESRLGRLGFGTHVATDCVDGSVRPYLAISACALSENVADLAAIPSEIWSSTDFGDVSKIKTVLQQQKLDMEQSFANSGHTVAMARALGYTTPRKYLAQHFGGIDYYRFVRAQLDDWDAVSSALPEKLAGICDRIFRTGGDLHSFTGPQDDMGAYWRVAGDFGLKSHESAPKLAIPAPTCRNEAFVVPSNVCFVAKGLDAQTAQCSYSGLWPVARQALNYEYLWNEIRVKGGAYGCGIRPDAQGDLAFYTYRDPNLDSSLARMDASAGWLASYSPSETEMEGFIVSSVATMDAPQRPYQIARAQDHTHLSRRDSDWRRKIREEALAASADSIRGLSENLENVAAHGAVCVVGSREIVESSHIDLKVVDLFEEK